MTYIFSNKRSMHVRPEFMHIPTNGCKYACKYVVLQPSKCPAGDIPRCGLKMEGHHSTLLLRAPSWLALAPVTFTLGLLMGYSDVIIVQCDEQLSSSHHKKKLHGSDKASIRYRDSKFFAHPVHPFVP